MSDKTPTTIELKNQLTMPRLSRLSLWYFVLDLLEMKNAKKVVVWTNRGELEFKIVDSDELARVWGEVKGRSNMTYSKFARAMRYYYGKGVIEKVVGKRFTYRFINSSKTGTILSNRMKSRNRRSSDVDIEEHINTVTNGRVNNDDAITQNEQLIAITNYLKGVTSAITSSGIDLPIWQGCNNLSSTSTTNTSDYVEKFNLCNKKFLNANYQDTYDEAANNYVNYSNYNCAHSDFMKRNSVYASSICSEESSASFNSTHDMQSSTDIPSLIDFQSALTLPGAMGYPVNLNSGISPNNGRSIEGIEASVSKQSNFLSGVTTAMTLSSSMGFSALLDDDIDSGRIVEETTTSASKQTNFLSGIPFYVGNMRM